MDATKQNLLDTLGRDRRQFVIPIYQRKYKWTSEQCNRLIDDIIKCGKKQISHFTGTVVYKQTGGTFNKAFLVDGQQRMTTIILIIKALEVISFTKLDDKNYKYVYDNTTKYLYADQADYDRGYKILPSENDRDTFNAIIHSKSIKELEENPIITNDKENHLFNNFKTIYERFLEDINNGVDIRYDIFEGICNLTIVEMTLDDNDDPQEIFESINSLGVRLTNADLIRNYLLMSNSNQESLYKNYWKPIQDNFIGENNMESFVNDYLLMKKCYAINYSSIYKEYVEFANQIGNGEDNRDELLCDLFNVATIYQPFLKECKSYSAQTNMLMQELRDMAQTTAYPFLMKVFLDKQEGIIDEETLDKVINLVIVYLVRRTICRIPTNSLRGFMLNLYNRIFQKVPSNKSRYYESVYAFLTTLNSRDAMPSETLLSKNLKDYPLYRNVKFATYLLYKIENGRYPNPYSEFVVAKSTTVEHIMPQNLSDEWIKSLGDDAENIHEVYVNTLGNLSLSSRDKNSSMSDDSFEDKKKILLTDGSKFEVLNKSIKNFETFGKKEIDDRELELEKILLEKYHFDDVKTNGIRFEDVEEITCTEEIESIFTGTSPISFKLFDVETPVDSFAVLLIELVKILYKKYPEVIRELAAKGYNPWNGEKQHIFYSESDEYNNVGDGIKLSIGLSAVGVIDFAIRLLGECDISSDNLIVVIKKDSMK